ncbi:MAG: biotin/lipoate A/B protein ligase family protein [Deltaproteobacteria bacterium]|nr:biotin/lipoate A/B protein ligase family protein [Deltaproteobacteria bacterium]
MNKWRLIIDRDLPGAENMARDESLLRAGEDGSGGGPVLRLYGWSEPTISIGYAQDASAFRGKGLPVVRRVTGGRAVIHGDEITYSITAACSEPVFSGGINGAYSVISRCIVAALDDMGIEAALARGQRRGGCAGRKDACFHTPSRYEVLAGGKKLAGSSQRRFKRAFLQHGSILFRIDGPLHERVFGPGVTERMACISSFSRAGKEEMKRALVKRFSEGLSAEFAEGGLTKAEEGLERELRASRYSSGEWNGASPLKAC